MGSDRIEDWRVPRIDVPLTSKQISLLLYYISIYGADTKVNDQLKDHLRNYGGVLNERIYRKGC